MDLEVIKNLKSDQLLAGCDEVGRGPLAGPVVAATAAMNATDSAFLEKLIELKVTDSKKLTSKKRLKILEALGIELPELKTGQLYKINIYNSTLSFVISEISPALIDEINILNASLKAMSDSANICFGEKGGKLLVDGNKIPMGLNSQIEPEAVVKGDSKSLTIGMASIIAKEYRDHLMETLDQIYPGYGLAGHAGYPTKKHLESIRELGVTPIHRKSFKGVKEYL